jgi:hypothetical protein
VFFKDLLSDFMKIDDFFVCISCSWWELDFAPPDGSPVVCNVNPSNAATGAAIAVYPTTIDKENRRV